MLAALIGCGVWLAVCERRTESGAALAVVLAVPAPRSRAGDSTCAPSRRSTCRSRSRPASRLAWYTRGRRAGGCASSARSPSSSRSTPVRACAGPAGWPVAGDRRRRRRWSPPCELSSQHGGPGGALSHVWHQLSGGGAVGSTDHLDALSTNLRGRWWGEAWDALPGATAGGATAPARSRRSTGWRGPTSSRPGRSTRPSSTCSRARAAGRASRRPSRWRPQAACMAAVTRLRGSERSAALALVAGVGAFALHNQIDWEWQQTALTLLAYPIPVLIACAAGGAVRRRRARAPPRPRGAGGDGVRARRHTRDAARAEHARARRAPTGSTTRAASTRRASRPISPPRSTARRSMPAQRASLLQQLGRPADARRAVDHALSLAPKDDRTWLALAGYQRCCWRDRGWRKSLAARARAVGPRQRLRGLRRRRSSRPATPVRDGPRGRVRCRG